MRQGFRYPRSRTRRSTCSGRLRFLLACSVGAALRVERGQGSPIAHAWWLTVKLLAIPALALGLIAWLGLTGTDAGILLLCAALPTASSAYILAVRMAGDGRAVATQITVGTLLSMITIPVWLALLTGT